MSEQPVDSRFTMPDVDDPPAVEVGVILLGLDPARLLAGLGLALLADDPGRVAVAVDRLRHGAVAVDADLLVAEGARHWRATRAAVAAAQPTTSTTAALRRAFTRAHRALEVAAHDPAALAGTGPAVRVYLAACWLRRADVDSAVIAALAAPDPGGPP